MRGTAATHLPPTWTAEFSCHHQGRQLPSRPIRIKVIKEAEAIVTEIPATKGRSYQYQQEMDHTQGLLESESTVEALL